MNVHTSLFDCEHPIVCAAMNQVSDAALAIAVHNAGAFPSLSIPSYIVGERFDMDAYRRDLRTYKQATGSDRLLLSIGSTLLLHDAIVQPFLDMGFRHFELFHWASTEPGWDRVLERSRRLSGEHGARFIFKVSTGHLRADLDYSNLLLKGPDGAGRTADHSPPLSEAFDFCRKEFAHANVIASGGICHADQVRDYLQRGAIAVAIGSLFAASRESSVSQAVKLKIIASSASELQTRGEHRLKGLFSDVLPGDNKNLTKTLASGVRRPDAGAIFMGSAVDHIHEILSVQEIVDRLVAPPAPGAAA